MSSVAVKFGCCERQTSSPNTLNCQVCKYKYHLDCINIKKTYKELSNEFKATFRCPSCLSKVPRTDNTDTPVRGASNQRTKDNCPPDLSPTHVNPIRGSQPHQKGSSNVTPESIRRIIREELAVVLDSFKASIVKEFELKTKTVLDRCDQISNALQGIEYQQKELKEDIVSNSQHITLLETENKSLRNIVNDLNSRICQIEQHARATNLEIQNVPEYRSENLVSIVKQIAAVTDCHLEDSDVQLCTRTAKINKDSRRPRSIVVKFTSQRTRDHFLASTLKYNKKSKTPTDKLNTSHLGIGGDKRPVFVVEHLSPVQKSLHAAARTKAKELNYKFVWVRSGKIFMRKTETSEYKLIKSNQDLLDIV